MEMEIKHIKMMIVASMDARNMFMKNWQILFWHCAGEDSSARTGEDGIKKCRTGIFKYWTKTQSCQMKTIFKPVNQMMKILSCMSSSSLPKTLLMRQVRKRKSRQ
ncbi:uncharacterized protein [Pocillopora verrucosa]|uniref:uncharacterized protein isoform X2 n=1 Tax=Pocillopora verrucosa TaxID=203993 RepID=UPI0033414970